MAIAALSNANSLQYQSLSNLNAEQISLQSLQQELGVGNLSSSQTAFNQLQKANQNLSSLGGASAPNTQTTADISALGTALSKSDLTGARTAFTSVEGDLANVNADAISAAVASAHQAVEQIDALLGTVNPSNSPSTDRTIDVAGVTTTLLSTVYGNHASSTASGSASTGGTINVSA